MKKIALLFILFYSNVIVSQSEAQYSMDYGDEFKLQKKHFYLNLIGNKKDGFVQFSIKNNVEIGIQVLDQTGIKQISYDVLDISGFGKGIQSEYFIESNKKYFWLYSIFDKNLENPTLYILEFDMNSKKFILPSKKLLSGNYVAFNNEKKLDAPPSNIPYLCFRFETFPLTVSNDSSKYLINYQIYNENKNGNKKLGFLVLDKEMNALWNKEIELPYNASEVNCLDYLINSAGDVYFLVRTIDPNSESTEISKKYDYQLSCLKKDASTPKVTKFKLEDMDCKSMKLQEVNKGTILISGFYSEKGITTGVALINIKVNNVTNAEISKSFIKIPVNIHEKFLNINCTIYDLEIEHLILEKDNGLLIIGTNKKYLGNGTATDKPIVLMKLNKNNNLQWLNVIPRKTGVTSSNGIGSECFFIFKHKNNQMILFQDGYNNKNIKLDEKPKLFDASSTGCLTIVEINENGDMVKNTSLFSECHEKPEYFKQISENKIIVKGGSYFKPFKHELIIIK